MAKEKKRKRVQDDTNYVDDRDSLDTSKPSAVFEPTQGGRSFTVSIALPGSIIANAKSHDQKTYLAGTIARALAVFCVDEVVIFDDEPQQTGRSKAEPGQEEYTAFTDPCHFLAHLLSYLETPAYLRRALFSMHPNLKTAGTLPSLDMPHHAKKIEGCEYREGVTIDIKGNKTIVEVGLSEHRELPNIQIAPSTRVTLKLNQMSLEAEAVSPTAPREEAGYYWGYTVRRCTTLSSIFTECPFDGGYDLSFGTSERGKPLKWALDGANIQQAFSHMLIVFGGVAGLEAAANNDEELSAKGIDGSTVSQLFDYWINLLPGQGSRTIRTEEAVWLGLMSLRTIVEHRQRL